MGQPPRSRSAMVLLYAYAAGNPAGLVDPMGLAACCPGDPGCPSNCKVGDSCFTQDTIVPEPPAPPPPEPEPEPAPALIGPPTPNYLRPPSPSAVGKGLADRLAAQASRSILTRIIETAGPIALGLLAGGDSPLPCTDARRRELQDEVIRNCKSDKFHCTGGMLCPELLIRIERAEACMKARRMINRECFGGGDAGHKTAELAAGSARANCYTFFRAKKC